MYVDNLHHWRNFEAVETRPYKGVKMYVILQTVFTLVFYRLKLNLMTMRKSITH